MASDDALHTPPPSHPVWRNPALRGGASVTDLPRPAVTITVHGIPTPQGSKSGFAIKRGGEYTGRVAMVEGSNKSAQARQRMQSWREAVRSAAQEAMGVRQPLDGPLSAVVVFTLPKPASAPKRRQSWPCKRPDLDKLLRAVFDAVTQAGVFRDDAQIIALTATKRYPDEHAFELPVPGAIITIRQIT